ncbi:MAG: 50S ribosomal protein L18 [Verrucomicrobiae bacterium]|nr:50S ribosomal protein L18 [Verrucomicrobiae bacterium]
MALSKQELRERRCWRIRHRVTGTADRPRMSVRFTGRNIHVQFIDDVKGVTLAAVSTEESDVRSGSRGKAFSNVAHAGKVGQLAAERAKQKGIKAVVFDRSGSKYHGKVKALADAAREAGLAF